MRVMCLSGRRDSAAESHMTEANCDAHDLGRRKQQQCWSPSQYVFLILATACLGVYGYAYLERMLYQSYESWAFDRDPGTYGLRRRFNPRDHTGWEYC